MTAKPKLHEAEEPKHVDRPGQSSAVCSLPPVVHSPLTGAYKARSSVPATIQYPPITNVSLTQNRPHLNGRLTSPKRRLSPTSAEAACDADVSERHDALRHYVDELERHMRTLQGTFITFTQKALVPLQTFCKLHQTK